jgi:hypothetical protein
MDGDDLYGLPLERFVPERGALARQLRSAGRREDAAAVAALRKPSIAAWAANQLVRGQNRAVAELFAAGDALRDAQSSVLAGRAQPRALLEATERERAAVDALLDKARGLLSSEGDELSPGILERVAETLHAAALDADARAQISDGRLQRELRHVGLGTGLETPSAPSRAKSRPSPKSRRAPSGEANARAEGATHAARERARARKLAQAAETEARRQADRATRALRAIEQRREHAADTLRRADEELAQARTDAHAAADAHRQAQQTLEGL